MARGNRQEAIFADDIDRWYFLKTLAEAYAMTSWKVHAWVLMGNHYHLVIETPEANLVVGMQWLQNTYTRRFNVRHQLWGRLFGDRYKSVLLEGAGYYYETLLDYVHLNPVRAKLVHPRRGQSMLDYPWSSVAGGYALPPARRPKWLAGDSVLSAFGGQDTAAGRRRWVERLDDRARAESMEKCGVPSVDADHDQRRSDLRRGWYWGSQAFAERMLKIGQTALTKTRSRSAKASREKQAHGEMEARRLFTEGMAIAGLANEDLTALPGSDPREVTVALVVWQNTTVGLTWIAENLKLRSAANASQQIRRHRLHPPPLPRDLKKWAAQSRNAA